MAACTRSFVYRRGAATRIDAVELRRALLLFAIVLGLAAIATSVSRPVDEEQDTRSEPRGGEAGTSSATARPGQDTGTGLVLRFRDTARARTRALEAGRAATVEVAVTEPGQVELEGLGLTAPAEPATPARFDVLSTVAARHAVRFTPAAGGEARTVGTLRVTADP